MGKENYLGSFLVGDFVFNYFMGSIFKSLVVGIFAVDVDVSVKNNLSLVDWIGIMIMQKQNGFCWKLLRLKKF